MEGCRDGLASRNIFLKNTTLIQVVSHPPFASAIMSGSMLECLAAWMKLSVREAAKKLLKMSEAERTQLPYKYAENAPAGLLRS